ncbi:MAG: thioesterase family protein [Cyclobacteriaceae bacterium]
MKFYSKKITVQSHHLDDLNHVNNVVYLQWVQDIAKDHWFSLAEEPFTSAHFWVVVRHELEYKKQAFLGDEILATTYVESFKGPFSIRCVEFKRGEDLLVKTRSNWCLIDANTQKPKRVPEDIQRLFL